MKIENLDLEKALQNGWTEWKKYGKNRLYFSAKKSELLDLGFYNSGNINFSEFKGEKISHSDANKLIASKVYIDLDTMELHVETEADEDMINEIIEVAVEKATTKKEVEEKELLVEVEETVEGITGNVLDMELSDEDDKNIDRLSNLFTDVVMSEADYDKLTDIWNTQAASSLKNLLEALKQAGLIIDYKISGGD